MYFINYNSIYRFDKYKYEEEKYLFDKKKGSI